MKYKVGILTDDESFETIYSTCVEQGFKNLKDVREKSIESDITFDYECDDCASVDVADVITNKLHHDIQSITVRPKKSVFDWFY